MKFRHTAPDWPSMIEDLERKGHTRATICAAMGFGNSDSIITHYKRGVQPLYHRGEPLAAFWCREMGKQAADIPRIAVRRPYRVPSAARAKQSTVADATASLQAFIASVQPPAKKRRGRPPKIQPQKEPA